MHAHDYNRQAVKHKQERNFPAAEDCYRQAIACNPDFAEAHFNLGLLYRDLHRVDDAIRCFQRTCELRPDVISAQLQLAATLTAAGLHDDAMATAAQAVARAPKQAEAHFHLGNAAYAARRWHEAEASYRSAIQIQTDWPAAYINLGNTLRELKRWEESADAYERALELDPGSAICWMNLGGLRRLDGHLDVAVSCYERALEMDATLWQAHHNLAGLFLETNSFAKAFEHSQLAVHSNPEDADCVTELGRVLVALERPEEAVECFHRALSLNSSAAAPAIELGHLCQNTGDMDSAQDFFQLAADLQPDNPLYTLRAAAMCPDVYRSQTDAKERIQQLHNTCERLRDSAFSAELARVAGTLPELPFNVRFAEGNLRPLCEAFAGVYRRYFQELSAEDRWIRKGRRPRKRPKIGFVVTHGHERAFNRLFRPVVERLSPGQFDLFIVCSELGATTLTGEGRVTPVHAYPQRFDLAAAAIAAEQFDLLYYWEIGSDPFNYFLPFLRLAPLQCTSYGLQMTTGIPNVDYYLSSHLVEVEQADQHYRESLVRADSLLHFEPLPAGDRPAADRLKLGLPKAGRLYGCLQRPAKIHPCFDRLLGQILKQDQDGYVLLLEDAAGYAAELLRERFERTLPEVSDRVLWLSPLAHQDYLAVLAACDVFLDPPHFGGFTTTYETLGVGVPVVTLPTEQQRGRYTAACLRLLELDDCIAEDCDDYVDIAVRVATDGGLGRSMSTQIRAAQSRLCTNPLAIQEHERIFHELVAGVR